MEEDKLLTIPEAAELVNTSMTTIYRYMRKGKLHFSTLEKHGKNIKVVSKQAVLKAFEIGDISRVEKHGKNMKKHVEIPTLENINKVIQEAILAQEKTLTKPLEKQAMFLAGKYEAENKFLQEKNETLLQEITDLKEAMKALPDLQEVERLKKEKEEQEKNLLEKSENIRILQKEKEVIMDLRDQADKKREELETRLEEEQKKAEELQEAKEQEIESLKEEEKDYLATIEELKKRLEEEETKPWWKKLFS